MASADRDEASHRRPGAFARIGHDPDAFASFYREHVTAVTRFVARRVADPHTVADLTAEVFLAVIGSAHTYRPGRGTQVAWLYGIARNVIAGEHRRAAHESRVASWIAGRRARRGTAGRAWPGRLAVTGAVSAALAAGLAVTLTVTSPGTGTPPAAGRFAPATTVAAVLDNAALAAQSERAVAPRPGQFIYTKSILAVYQPRHHGYPRNG